MQTLGATASSRCSRLLAVAIVVLATVAIPPASADAAALLAGPGSVTALADPVVERLSGPTRVQTAIAISQRLYPATAPAVVVATGDAFPDALAGGPLAHLVGGPLLLLHGDTFAADVAAEVSRLAPARAFVLGGSAAIPSAIDARLAELGVGEVIRLAGRTRYETAAAIAARMRAEGAGSGYAMVVSGHDWPDATAAGPIAGILGCPVVLADGATLPAVSRAALAAWDTSHTIVVGGTAAVPDQVLAALPDPERIGGADRYQTAMLLAARGLALGLEPGTIVLASGRDFPDALAGSPLAADVRAPILLSMPDALSSAASVFIAAHAEQTDRAILLGGTSALSLAVEDSVRALLGLPSASGWRDTSDRVAVFSDQISESISPAQLAFVAAHYDGSQKQTRSFARSLRALSPGYLVIHYRLGLGLGYQSGGDWISIIEGDEWVREWPASPQDSWFYRYGGERVLQTDWGWYLIDVDDPAWRTWWTGEVERQMAEGEASGLFIDSYSVPNFLGGGSYDPALPGYDPAFEAEWTARMDRYSAYLMGRPALRPVIANAGQWVTSRDEVRYDLLDGVMIEGLGQWGPGSPFDESDWVLQQDRILSLSRAGRIVLGQAYLDTPADGQGRRLVTGSYLLSKGTRSYLCLELGSEPEWFPEYGLDLGAATDALPASIDGFRLSSGLYRRRFQHAVVLVNPTGAPISVTVADAAGAGDWDLATFVGGGELPAGADVSSCRIDRAPVTNLTVPAYDAAFVLAR